MRKTEVQNFPAVVLLLWWFSSMGIPDMVTVAVFMESRKKAKKKTLKNKKLGNQI